MWDRDARQAVAVVASGDVAAETACAQAWDDAPHVLAPEVVRRLDVHGPRYTSYPTADRFTETFGETDYRRALRLRAAGPDQPLSLYVHVPFCASLCYYCGCNKVVTRHYDRALAYLGYLRRELALHAELLGGRARVGQLHFGGGTPTFLRDEALRGLMTSLREAFDVEPDAECSIEVDPRTIDRQRLATLAELGFNRLSFGVQDFDPDVQQAVHRVQPAAQVFDLVDAARSLGFQSINVDLIYGLPRQTPASFQRTLEQIDALRPDRIALYAYAHLPQRFKPQRRIVPAELPDARSRLAMLDRAIGTLTGAGYVYIGMDHFALPDDALARAKAAGTLHRNFQGYSTQADCDLVAIGVSAIGRVGAVYSQNAKTLDEYYARLGEGRLPVVRGWHCTDDDLMRRQLIMALMCDGRLDVRDVERRHGLVFGERFAQELRQLAPFADEGLVRLSDDLIEITRSGWFVVRAIAAVFDAHRRAGAGVAQHSRMI